MLINGIESNHIDAMDRGLAYGDGLFTTIKVEYGVLQLWDFHLQRLQSGAKALFFPAVDWQQLTSEVKQTAMKLVDYPEHVIKIILTRGCGGRGYSVQNCDSPMRIISDAIYPDFYLKWQKEGIDIILCESTLSSNKQLAGLKTLNRLEQVLIKRELECKQAIEGIVCDENGYVIEGCAANLFIYINGGWQTPKVDKSGVAGVQRRDILTKAKASSVNIIESNIHKDQLIGAEEIFFSNSLMGIVPVKKYKNKILKFEHCRALQLRINTGSN